MDPLLATLILILVALLGARVTFSTERAPAGPRLLFRTGTHFLLIGYALGPSALGLLSTAATRQLSPFLALGLGWVGFHFGLQLDRATLGHFPSRFHVLALGQAVIAFGIFFGAILGLTRVLGFEGEIVVLLTLAAACTAAITTPAGIAMVSSNFLVKGPVRDLLFFVGSVDALVGIVALQVTYSVYRPVTVAAGLGAFPQLALIGVALGLGLVCGIVFLWLVRGRTAREELVLYLLGSCAFAAGAALTWGLSPLFVAVVMGAVVANLGTVRPRVMRVLQRWEKPVYVTFLLLGGALVQVPGWWIFPMAAGYALLRFVSKLGGAALMVSALRFEAEIPRGLGLGLVPQGGISIAMAISGVLMYPELRLRSVDAQAVLFAVIVLGVMMSELVGPSLTARLLRRSGELSLRVEAAITEGDHALALRVARGRAGGGSAPDGGPEDELAP